MTDEFIYNFTYIYTWYIFKTCVLIMLKVIINLAKCFAYSSNIFLKTENILFFTRIQDVFAKKICRKYHPRLPSSLEYAQEKKKMNNDVHAP